jgi:hypothetical protein
MDIRHPTIFDKDAVIKHYSEKDGVEIKYVCTTDLQRSDVPADIFYRETPHPVFGNRYFSLFYKPSITGNSTPTIMIGNADIVETFEFGMIKSSDDQWYYSASHHDCIFIEEKMIDGGRAYIRSSGLEGVFKIVNGEFVNAE